MTKYRTCVSATYDTDRDAIKEYLLKKCTEDDWGPKGIRWEIGLVNSVIRSQKPMLKTWLRLIKDNPNISLRIIVNNEETNETVYMLLVNQTSKDEFVFIGDSTRGYDVSMHLDDMSPKTVCALMKGKAHTSLHPHTN